MMKTIPTYWKVVVLSLAGLLLVACATIPEASASKPIQITPDAGLPNPASVYCQDQGGRLEIRTNADGGQFGVCIFSDDSECEEWAYYRAECSLTSNAYIPVEETSLEKHLGESETAPSAHEPVPNQTAIAWVGHISSTPSGSQYDDYLSLMPAGTGEIGINGDSAEIEDQLVALRDGTGIEEFPMLWGELSCGVPDFGGCQLLVHEVRYGQFLVDPAPVEGWQGHVTCSHFNSSPSNLCGHAFVLDGDFSIWYGLWSPDPQVLVQIDHLRDTGQTIQIWGQLLAGVPDVNGTQIQVDRIEVID